MRIFTFLVLILTISACDDDEIQPNNIPAPDIYAFERAGESTVDFSGQTERLNQVAELKSKLLAEADKGNAVTAEALLNAYENTDGNGGGLYSFASTKQLKDKTFAPDRDARLFEKLFDDLAAASEEANSGVFASNGQAGLITREGSGKTILVDARGREFTQLIEKGLMGAVFYHQIFNVYLTEDRIGDAVENEAVLEGKSYTEMEHHWDEAFGYWHPPLDFTSSWPESRMEETRFWSRYSNVVDNIHNGLLGTNKIIMVAFINGRTAIVNKDYETRDAQKEILYENLDLVAAATCVHYINSTLKHINQGHTGESFHTLSEAWAFVNALRYNPMRRLSLTEIESIMESDFGENGNFWNVTVNGLNSAKNKIISAYPALIQVADVL